MILGSLAEPYPDKLAEDRSEARAIGEAFVAALRDEMLEWHNINATKTIENQEAIYDLDMGNLAIEVKARGRNTYDSYKHIMDAYLNKFNNTTKIPIVVVYGGWFTEQVRFLHTLIRRGILFIRLQDANEETCRALGSILARLYHLSLLPHFLNSLLVLASANGLLVDDHPAEPIIFGSGRLKHEGKQSLDSISARG